MRCQLTVPDRGAQPMLSRWTGRERNAGRLVAPDTFDTRCAGSGLPRRRTHPVHGSWQNIARTPKTSLWRCSARAGPPGTFRSTGYPSATSWIGIMRQREVLGKTKRGARHSPGPSLHVSLYAISLAEVWLQTLENLCLRHGANNLVDWLTVLVDDHGRDVEDTEL